MCVNVLYVCVLYALYMCFHMCVCVWKSSSSNLCKSLFYLSLLLPDLQLVVKNCKNLMESFNKYVEFEMLDGENKYDAEGFGKQDAKRGAKFMTLPPILMLHLKRFEYDWERDHAYKINDRYEFPVDTNLDAFLAPEAERGDTNDYTLLR